MPGRRVLQTLSALYVAQTANVILPLVTVPFLARALGAHEWGAIALAQACAAWLALVIDYGFSITATRDVARAVGDRGQIGRILAGVQGAKLVVALGAGLLAVAAALVVPLLQAQPTVAVVAIGAGIAQGFHPGWLFQGLERLRLVSAVDAALKVAATVATIILVQAPGDGWRALACIAAAWGASTIFATTLAYRTFGIPALRWATTVAALRQGRQLFTYRVALSLYSTTNALLLGLLAPAAAVAYFVGADKIVRAPLNLLWPVIGALYPHANRIAADDPRATWRLARRTLQVATAAAAIAAGAIALAAPELVRLLLGPDYHDAVPTLRIMTLLLPLIAASTVIGTQIMLPAGMDRQFTRIAITAGVINVTVALALAPTLHQVGMAWAVVASETGVLLWQWRVTRHLLRSEPTLRVRASAASSAGSSAGRAWSTPAPAAAPAVRSAAPAAPPGSRIRN